MKGIKAEPEVDVQIDLNVTSYIPDKYISDSNQKFGNMPEELENLIDIARIKYLAKTQNVSKIVSKKTAVVFTYEPNKFETDISDLVKKYGNKIRFSAGIKPMVTVEIGSNNERQILNDVTEFLKM